MKRAAILVLAIATLVMIVSPSAYSLTYSTYTDKSGTSAPGVISPSSSTASGPWTNSGSGGSGGTDQGDADGLSGMKVKPVTTTSFAVTSEWISISLTMWWRFMILIR